MDVNGQIFVNDYLQVTNVNPLKKDGHSMKKLSNEQLAVKEVGEVLKDPKVYENIFCLGDACLTSANEEKSVTPLKQCVDICFNNILNIATTRGKLKSIPRVFPGLYSISLGPEEGIIVVNN